MSRRRGPNYNFTRPVVAVLESTSVADAIKLMNDRKISSLLLHNDDERVVGILTERDVLRRLMLLDVADKLDRPVGTVATREVLFADAENVHESVIRLHFEKGLRHFPVLRGKDPVLANVVGIVTITDVIRHYLQLELQQLQQTTPARGDEPVARPLSVICRRPTQIVLYQQSFGKVGFTSSRVDDPGKFFRENMRGEVPLIFDFDGYSQVELSSLIVQAKNYPGHLIMTASNQNAVNAFSRFLDKDRQTMALKPFDADYLSWLLTTKWGGTSESR